MRIGHYSPWLLSPGGINTYLRRVVQGQVEGGHEIVLFNRPHDTRPKTSLTFDPDIVTTRDDLELFRLALDRGVDVLHLHTCINVSAFDSIRLPIVRTMHGHEAYCPSGSRHLQKPASRPCPRAYHLLGCTWGHFVNRCGSVRPANFLNNFHRVKLEQQNAERFFTIAISSFVRNQMVRSGYDATRIQVILNPAPPVVLEPAPASTESPACFLALGRLVPQKGIDWLFRAVARLDVPARVVIAGSGPEKNSLQRLANLLGISEKVEWRGWLEQEEVFAELSRARAAVVPSIWHEPAGLVPLEAAAAGRAVIASRVGGIPEYVELLQNSLLVEPFDIAGLTAAMRRLVVEPGLAASLGATGRKQVIELSLDSHLRKLDEVYQKAIADTVGRTPGA
jgi:glycosyltransferase involved in cell wall biosynthesis